MDKQESIGSILLDLANILVGYFAFVLLICGVIGQWELRWDVFSAAVWIVCAVRTEASRG